MPAYPRKMQDLGFSYFRIYRNRTKPFNFPPYARTPDGKIIIEYGETKCRECNHPFPSGPVSIRPHTKARHGLVALEGYKGGAGPNLNQLREYYKAMHAYHSKYIEYSQGKAEKPTFSAIGPEQARVAAILSSQAEHSQKTQSVQRELPVESPQNEDKKANPTTSERDDSDDHAGPHQHKSGWLNLVYELLIGKPRRN